MSRKHITRRGFLKVSAVTAAGLALGACGQGATSTTAQTSAPAPHYTLLGHDLLEKDVGLRMRQARKPGRA